jgi:hypothetical protein
MTGIRVTWLWPCAGAAPASAGSQIEAVLPRRPILWLVPEA